VKEYLGNAMRKLGATSRVEAALKAERLGLIEAEEPSRNA
jgi:DNA-binding NarL/FixJ family response regulator